MQVVQQIFLLQTVPQEKMQSGNKYFSDTVVITLHYKNGESVTKNIEIKFDNDNNVIVGYEK